MKYYLKKTEEFRTWKPRAKGRILICSSAKKYEGFVSGYAFCIVEIGDINEYRNNDGSVYYGWKLMNVEYVKPFHMKGKLHLFEVDDELIYPLKDVDWNSFAKIYYKMLTTSA